MLRIGTESEPTDAEEARANAGALLTAQLIHDVRLIRQLLTPPKQ